MKVLGVTGGIATGKSNITKLFVMWGIPVVDADEISRQLTKEKGKALPFIQEAFGEKVFDAQGRLNRKALGEVVFSNPEEKEKLENILHPFIEQEMKRQLEILEAKGVRVAVIDVPLLFEAGMSGLADEIWLTYAPVEEQVRRLEKRNGLTQLQAMERITSQWPFEKKKLLADEIIDTTGPKEETAKRVKNLFSKHFYSIG
ncbi:MAG: dephospho-CoA kinase [Clostridiales bacterium]|nr:dephospho-CoA kinase [Clostridiales bacterium]